MTNTKSTKRALLSSVVALLLCFSMLLGTTYAWFTDSVTSTGNIIKTGTLDVAMSYADGSEDPATAQWKDASEVAIFDYKNWEPGYVAARHLKIENKGSLALNWQLRIVANGVVSKLADVIDVYYLTGADVKALTRADVAGLTPLGTLTEILGTNNNISKTAVGQLKAGDPATVVTLVLKMQEDAGNEYQNLEFTSDFSVQLIATQMADENDSFGNDYDATVPSPKLEVPAALVRPLENIVVDIPANQYGPELHDVKLNTAYQFEPTDSYDVAQNSEYRWWHADFVASADKDVEAGAMALAGYYSLFGDWVALVSDTDITVGTDVRLVDAMGGGSITVAYDDLCNFGNDGTGFQCGAAALSDSVAGTTLSVELRLYEATCDTPGCHHSSKACETGEYVTIGKFTYTFPAKEVASQADLNTALTNGGTISLAAGEYKMPSNQASTADLTIVGTKDTVIDVTLGAYMDQATVTFKGVTIKTSTGKANGNGSDYAALYTPNVTYIDCTFEGPMRVGRDGAKFINCTFNSLGNDYIWTYGNDVTFEGCTFNTDGKAILIYSDGGNEVANVTVKNCTFNSTQGAKAGAISNQNCAAIEIHNYGNGVNLVTENNAWDSNFSGEWRIKTYESGKPQVIVNGTEYTKTALDGHLMTVTGGVADMD